MSRGAAFRCLLVGLYLLLRDELRAGLTGGAF